VLKAVKLLEGLQVKVAEAEKLDQQTFAKYQGWCQKVSQTTQSDLTTNQQRQEALSADIAKAAVDMSGASAHLSEIAQYSSADEADLKASTILRQKESTDFKSFELELVEGLQTTQAAAEKLQQDISAAAPAPASAFLQKTKKPSKAMNAFSDVMAELAQAASLSVTDDMGKYPSLLEEAEKSRSGMAMARVESELEGLSSGSQRATPEASLKESLQLLNSVEAKATSALEQARTSEAQKNTDYHKIAKVLRGKTGAEAKDLAATKKAYADASALKASSEGELAVTVQSEKTSKDYLQKVERNCMEKASQFQSAKTTRAEEQIALRNALKELQFIQGRQADQPGLAAMSFVQLSSSEADVPGQQQQPEASLVLRRIKDLAVATSSPALTQLASRIHALSRYGGSRADVYSKIRAMIEEMVSRLDQTNREEMTKKAFCEQEVSHTVAAQDDRQDEATRKKIALSLATAQLTKLRESVADHSQQLAGLASSEQAMTQMREQEHVAHVKGYKDLQFGLSGVQASIKALRDVYALDKQGEQVDMAANMELAASGQTPGLSDDAPAAKPYGANIVGLLEVIESSFAKNMADLQSQDRNAQESFEELRRGSKSLKGQKEADVKHMTTEATNLERTVTELQSDEASARQQLDAVNEYYGRLKTECSPAKADSSEQRATRRNKEMDGLREALSILESS
jgi:BMFP domain-containing protein YqiC